MILGEVRRYLRDNNSIRVSRSLRDTAYKAIYARESLTKKNLKEPTLCEIAEEIGVNSCYLSDIFHKHMGEPYSRYLLRIRMEQAARLLREKPGRPRSARPGATRRQRKSRRFSASPPGM